jgi:hypothetical protein
MDRQACFRIVDYTLAVVASLTNVLIIGIMLSRPAGLRRLEVALGWAFMALALPVGLAVVVNGLGRRPWWAIALPALLLAFMMVELVLDHILKLGFRTTRLLWPYLTLYYLSQWGIMGYAFSVGRPYGFIALATYLLNLLATWYSYSQVGHG